MAPTLYYLAASIPCRAVMLTAEALGLELNLQETDLFDKKDHLQPWFLEMNPAHSIPTLKDDGFALGESRAIMGYLVQKYGKDDSLYPKDPKDRALVDQMLNFDLGSIAGSIVPWLVNIIFKKCEASQEQLDKIKDKLSILDAFLQKRAYAAGPKLSIADLSLIGYVTILDVLGFDYSNFKNIVAWVKKMKALPFYEKANQKGHNKLAELIQTRRNEMKA